MKVELREIPPEERDLRKKNIEIDALKNQMSGTSKYTMSGIKLVPQIIAESSLFEKKRCTICWGTIKPSDVTEQCPVCKATFHKAHLDQWLKKKNICPKCRNKIT